VSPLHPVRAPARLRWLRPPALDAERFEKLRPRLERLAREPHPESYTAKRRALYRVQDAELGAVAIKEIRTAGAGRRLLFLGVREHPGLREFRVGAAFEARGGATPEFFGAAVERGVLGIRRVLLFFRWLDEARDLAEELRRTGPEPEAGLLASVAAALAAHARLGLVHGRHAPGNLLMVPRPDGFEVLAIDFAYASLGGGFDEGGWVRDVSRVAHHVVYFELCTREKVREFLALAAEAVEEGAAERKRLLGLLLEDTSRRLRETTGRPL
jgi:hypothetical protein